VITKSTQYGDVEENQHDVISSHFESEKLVQAVDEFAKQLKIFGAWRDNEHS